MKRTGNLWGQIISYDNLLLAYKNARKGKRWQRNVKSFEKDVEGNLLKLQKQLKDKTFTTSEYKTKTIYEPKQRVIYILPFYPDRIVQHALLQIISPIWDKLFIHDSYACRVGKGMHQASKKIMKFISKYDYCLKCDISKFYPSINHTILLQIIEKKIKCKDTIWLLSDIINSFEGETNTPIGNYTSQWFGNLYMNELDYYIKHTLKCRFYMRYCDDFIILNNDKKQLFCIKEKINDFINNNLKLKFSKWSIFNVNQGIDFLGYRHFRNKVLLRKSTAKRVQKRFKKLPILFNLNKITIEQFGSSIASTNGWIKWSNSHNLSINIKLQHLKDEYERVSKIYKQQTRCNKLIA